MRPKALRVLVLAIGLALGAPGLWSAVVRRGSVGPLAIDVDNVTSTVRPGRAGHADVLIANHHSSATLELAYVGMLRFSNGDTMPVRFLPAHFALNPGDALFTSATYVVPSTAPSGPAVFWCGVRVLGASDPGGTWSPPEPTGAWEAEGLTVL
jgi:hypothetical protein